MTTAVELTENAFDDLEGLDGESRERIVSKLESVADFPDHYLDPLTNFPGYKLRVGDFRVVVDWDRNEQVVYVVAVLERKHDYRELRSLRNAWGAWRE